MDVNGSDSDALSKREACEAVIHCRFSKMNNQANKDTCVPRSFIEVIQHGPSKNCPRGTDRKRDSYRGGPGTYFDTCIPDIPNGGPILNCDEYQWDGWSCKTCALDYRPAMVAAKRGNGRLKSNAICVIESGAVGEINNRCAVFYYEHTPEAGKAVNGHHKCKRCMEGYRWQIGHHGEGHQQGLCVGDTIRPSLVVAVDTRVLLALVLLAVIATGIYYMRSGPAKVQEAQKDLSLNIGVENEVNES